MMTDKLVDVNNGEFRVTAFVFETICEIAPCTITIYNYKTSSHQVVNAILKDDGQLSLTLEKAIIQEKKSCANDQEDSIESPLSLMSEENQHDDKQRKLEEDKYFGIDDPDIDPEELERQVLSDPANQRTELDVRTKKGGRIK